MNIFPALIGNSAIKELCGEDILRRKSSHAYIIDGPAGSGKHTAALEIAKALLCERKGESLPCGKCLSCRKADEGYNSCIHFLSAEGKATITVEAVRRTIATVDFLPDDGDFSIYIIEEAEKMNPQAQNALLLTLEEPPRHVVFILLTCDALALLETVRSRAITLKTEMLSPAVIQREAVRRYGDTEKVRSAAASASTLGEAIEMIKSSDSEKIERRKTSARLASLLAAGDACEAVVFMRELKYDRQNMGDMLYGTSVAIRDMIVEKCGGHETLFYTSPEEAKKEAGTAQLPHLERVYRETVRAADHIKNKNASAQTVLTSLAAVCRTK